MKRIIDNLDAATRLVAFLPNANASILLADLIQCDKDLNECSQNVVIASRNLIKACDDFMCEVRQSWSDNHVEAAIHQSKLPNEQ